MSREKAENMAESVVNEWNADYIEEDSTIDPDKDETLDNKKFYAHLERLIADAIEKAVAEDRKANAREDMYEMLAQLTRMEEQQAEIDRLKAELEAERRQTGLIVERQKGTNETNATNDQKSAVDEEPTVAQMQQVWKEAFGTPKDNSGSAPEGTKPGEA